MTQRKTAIVQIANEKDFELKVLRSELAIVAVFWVPWSHPCKILDLVLKEVADACAGSWTVAKVNADDNPALSLWYGIQSVPTLLFFVRGVNRAQIVGTASKEAILAKLHSLTR